MSLILDDAIEITRKVYDEEAIAKRVKELGVQITEDFKGEELIVIGVIKGSVYFFSDLTKNIKLPLMLDFARLSSYRSGTTSGQMELIYDITAKIEGRDVILVEDIVDSGKTLAYFIELLKKRNPTSVKVCAFIDKKERREVDIKADYVGFDIPCGFVIGYGMDYAEKYRELPFLAEVIDADKL